MCESYLHLDLSRPDGLRSRVMCPTPAVNERYRWHTQWKDESGRVSSW